MFVRRVETRAKGAASGVSYRLCHSVREGAKVRQVILAHFPAGLEERVPRTHWPRLAAAIRERLAGQTRLPADLPTEPAARALEDRLADEAELMAPRVRQRLQAREVDLGFRVADDPRPAHPGERPLSLLPSTLRHTDVREAGAARLLLHLAADLRLREALEACGLRPRYVRLGLAQILARALHPASERETYRWLRDDSALPELLGCPPSELTRDALYRAADALWRHRTPLERTLFSRERHLFDLEARVVFYDLTHTFHTGHPHHRYAAYGRSKQKRQDCPWVTLGLLLDREGFPRRSEVLPGKVGEAPTLRQAIERLALGADERPTVIFDGGIVSAENLRWLRAQGLHWITVERQRQPTPEREPDTLARTAQQRELKVWRLAAEPGGEPEARLCVWSPARHPDEEALVARKRQQFEAALAALHTGLTTPGRLKAHERVLRKVGRLQEVYQLVAHQYTVSVEAGERGRARAVRWERNARFAERDRIQGTSLLRTSRTDWDDERIVREYCRLADIEATFRACKDELGLRPLDHRLGDRVAGHLFVTVLAYHVVHALRLRLRAHGISLSWASIRHRCHTWVRLTTAMRTADGKVWSQRQDVDPNNEQARLASAAGLSFRRHRNLVTVDRAVVPRARQEG